MARTRAADGFATIRVRMEELRRERERRQPAEGDLERDAPMRPKERLSQYLRTRRQVTAIRRLNQTQRGMLAN